MEILELFLIILVSVWTVIFIIIAIILLFIFFAVKKALGRANRILEETENVAKRVDLPSKVVIASILAFMTKNIATSVKDFIALFLKGKIK